MGKLSLCPLCAGEAMAQENHWRDGNLRGGEPFCKKCGLKMPRHWPGRKAEAITAWNTRPLPQPSEDQPAPYTCKHSCERDALMAQIAKLQADGDKLAGALDRSRQGWSNVLELGLLPVQHQSTALGLQEAATQALIEWKDRA